MNSEPVLTALTALVAATAALLVAFGVHVTDDQVKAIVGFVVALYAVAVWIRSKVSPVVKKRRAAHVDSAKRRS